MDALILVQAYLMDVNIPRQVMRRFSQANLMPSYLSRQGIRSLLGLHSSQEQILKSIHSGMYPRGSGRTTDMLVEALYKAQYQRVSVRGNGNDYTRVLVRQLMRYATQLHVCKETYPILNISQKISHPYECSMDFPFTDHSLKPDTVWAYPTQEEAEVLSRDLSGYSTQSNGIAVEQIACSIVKSQALPESVIRENTPDAPTIVRAALYRAQFQPVAIFAPNFLGIDEMASDYAEQLHLKFPSYPAVNYIYLPSPLVLEVTFCYRHNSVHSTETPSPQSCSACAFYHNPNRYAYRSDHTPVCMAGKTLDVEHCSDYELQPIGETPPFEIASYEITSAQFQEISAVIDESISRRQAWGVRAEYLFNQAINRSTDQSQHLQATPDAETFTFEEPSPSRWQETNENLDEIVRRRRDNLWAGAEHLINQRMNVFVDRPQPLQATPEVPRFTFQDRQDAYLNAISRSSAAQLQARAEYRQHVEQVCSRRIAESLLRYFDDDDDDDDQSQQSPTTPETPKLTLQSLQDTYNDMEQTGRHNAALQREAEEMRAEYFRRRRFNGVNEPMNESGCSLADSVLRYLGIVDDE